MKFQRALIRIAPLATIGAVLLSGCGAPPVSQGFNTYTHAPAFNPGDAAHSFSVKAVDSAGKPIKGANVEWKTEANGKSHTQNVATDENGKSNVTLTVKPKFSPTNNRVDYASSASYVVSSDGYYSKRGNLTQDSYRSPEGNREATPAIGTAVLLHPTDYLAAEFAQAKQYAQLREKVLAFLNVIRLQSVLNQSDLKLNGVSMQEFKGKRYLTFELNSDNVFNSLKLDRYGIGKEVFDETVRKTLNPLNDKISDPKLFYGYNIIVNTKVKNFTKEYDAGEKLKYEFMMPQAVVRNYKNKDISGQKLVDESVVLLNDERIDLKFQ
jgi:hypothetical protein